MNISNKKNIALIKVVIMKTKSRATFERNFMGRFERQGYFFWRALVFLCVSGT